jgi:3-deoxy-D-manno-octulosonic-acid transferase
VSSGIALLQAAPGARPFGSVTRFKWLLFSALEWLADRCPGGAPGPLGLDWPAAPTPALWCFVSTIGELNAIDPFLQRLLDQLGHLKLVLITDHDQYREVYKARFPGAIACVSRGHGSHARQLARHFPPRLLLVGEIPCRLSDAPCRFSFAFLYEARRCGAVTAIANGWLYGAAPASRIDAIERRWFARDYLRGFDAICVQNEAARLALLDEGADAANVHAVGNIKFDAVAMGPWNVAEARSASLLQGLLASKRPVIVAGCVTNLDEQALVLDAFVALRATVPDALLVLAPRHPENAERMRALRAMLDERRMAAGFRTTLPDAPVDAGMQCVVLDTIGELKDFYAVATVAHVGINHNVLEPLAFGKAITVSGCWEPVYPSFPVYRLLLDSGVVESISTATEMSSRWFQICGLNLSPPALSDSCRHILVTIVGSTDRHIDIIGRELAKRSPLDKHIEAKL